MSRPVSSRPAPYAAALVLLASAGACQAIAGLSSLEIDADGSGGASSSASGTSSVTGSASAASTTGETTTGSTGATTSSSSGSAGGGGEATTGGGNGGDGGDGGTGRGGAGGNGGNGGNGGRGGAEGTGGNGGDGGDGTTIGSSSASSSTASSSSASVASSSSSTGGGTCSDELGCPTNDVCHINCDQNGCGTGSCHACSDGPPQEDPGMCPPFCEGDCKALDLCEFNNVAGVPGFGGPNLHLNTGITNMRLDCTTATPCVNKNVQCGDPNLNGPRTGPYNCTLRCESAAACQNITFDCTGQPGACLLECTSAGACDGVQVMCGPNKCEGSCNGASDVDVDADESCGPDFTSCD